MNIYISQIGLLLDFAGAWLIYEYDLKDDKNKERENKTFWKATGFVLISIGFILQFIEPWCNNSGILMELNTNSSDASYFNL